MAHHRAKMTDAQALRALELSRAGLTDTAIAAELGVPHDSVSSLLSGRGYRHIPGERRGEARPYPPLGAGHHHYGKRKLDAATQAEIRRVKAEEGLTNRQLAAQFGVSPTLIGLVIRGTYEESRDGGRMR